VSVPTHHTLPTGLEIPMIMLCERCFAPIDQGEPVVRLAHIDAAHPNGNISWVYSYLHTAGCATPRPASHERPDTSTWDPARGIASRRP
jgi:hypothetical protein